MPDFDEMMVREAFARVKQDILELRSGADRYAERIETLSATLPQLTDKKEFYEFIARLRAELDLLASRVDLDTANSRITSLQTRLEQKEKEISNLELNLRGKAGSDELRKQGESLRADLADVRAKTATKDALKRSDDWHAKAFKTLEGKFVRDLSSSEERSKKAIAGIEQSVDASEKKTHQEFSELRKQLSEIAVTNERLKESVAQLKLDARSKERQIARLKEKVTGKRVKDEPRPFPLAPVLGVIALIAIVIIILLAIPSFTPVQGNATVSDPVMDACIADFECYDLGQNQFYSGCAYNDTLGNCRCDIVSNVSLCNADARDAAASRLAGSSSPVIWPWVVVVVLVGLFVLFLLSRRAQK